MIPDSRKLTYDDWFNLFWKYRNFIIGVGQIYDYRPRMEIFKQIKKGRWKNVLTVIAKDAFVANPRAIEEGTVIMHNAVINAGASIGRACIINTAAIVEHDASVGQYTHISTGAVVNGDALIGKFCFVGSNAVVLNGIRIGDNVMIGAGSVVTHDILEPGIYVGNPAKFLKEIPCPSI